MLFKTRGVVFKTVKYSDTSIITNIYTEQFGLQSYIINGARSSKSKSNAALYQHGNLLDLVVYHKPNGSIFRISESEPTYIYEQLPYNIVKSSLMIFYIEILNKTLKEHENNSPLFDFIFENLIELDQTDRKLSNHHIWFLLGLSKYLGFFPATTEGAYFDLREGMFADEIPASGQYLSAPLAAAFRTIIEPELINYDQIVLPAAERKILLHQLLTYYRLHMSDFGMLNSLIVLEELFGK